MDGCITSVFQSREARQPRRPRCIFHSATQVGTAAYYQDRWSFSPRGMDFKCLFVDIKLAPFDSIREKVAKACNRPVWTPSAAPQCRNWPCNFPYVSLAEGTNLPGHDKLLFDHGQGKCLLLVSLTRKIFRKILDCFAQWEKELEIRLKDRYSNGYVQICWRITFPLTLLIVGDRLAPYIWFHLIFLKHRVSSVSHGIIIRTRFRKIHFRSPLMHRIN